MNRLTVDRMEELMPLVREALEAGQSVRVYPHGTSMMPMLRQDIDSVVLAPVAGRLKKYDIPLYQRDNGKYVLHRVTDVSETYTCMGDNQYVAEKGIRDDQIIAVVNSFYRGDREIPADGLLYRVYCTVWNTSRPARCFARRAVNWLKRHL